MNENYEKLQLLSDQRLDMIQATSEQLTLKLIAVEDRIRERLGLERTAKNGPEAILNMRDHETGSPQPISKTISIDGRMFLEANAKFILKLANSEIQLKLNVKCSVAGECLIIATVGNKEEEYITYGEFVGFSPFLVLQEMENMLLIK